MVMLISDGQFVREENDSIRFSVKCDLIWFSFPIAWHSAVVQVSSIFKVQIYHETLTNHESLHKQSTGRDVSSEVVQNEKEYETETVNVAVRR